jgi:hypothetical protein
MKKNQKNAKNMEGVFLAPAHMKKYPLTHGTNPSDYQKLQLSIQASNSFPIVSRKMQASRNRLACIFLVLLDQKISFQMNIQRPSVGSFP